ncbi:MAG TPA: glycosyltransferase [Bacteroidota bacterium]
MITVFFSDIPWYGLHQRPQHLATRFAKHTPLLWIEPATLGAETHFSPRKVSENIHTLSMPQFPHNARNRVIRWLTWPLSILLPIRLLLTWVQLILLRRAIKELEVENEPAQFFVQNFQFSDLIEECTPTVLLFDYIDNAFGFVRFPRYVHRAWVAMIKRANVVTATSPTLVKLIAQHNVTAMLVTNGVEYEFFTRMEKNERPADIPNDGKPIIGYIGSIYAWFDFDLVRLVASKFDEAHVILIGHKHPVIREESNALQSLPNVHFLGIRPYPKVPEYLRHFDVGIIPFKRNRLTESVNPVKLYEYSAAGLPTVSTFFSDDLNDYRSLIFVGGSHEEFVSLITVALTKKSDDSFAVNLQSFAREHDWDAIAEKLWSVMSTAENDSV